MCVCGGGGGAGAPESLCRENPFSVETLRPSYYPFLIIPIYLEIKIALEFPQRCNFKKLTDLTNCLIVYCELYNLANEIHCQYGLECNCDFNFPIFYGYFG